MIGERDDSCKTKKNAIRTKAGVEKYVRVEKKLLFKNIC